jgi:hypothetical protein
VLELCIHAFERVCFVPLSDSSLCFVSCALEFMFCGLLCCVPSVLQAFGLCFKHLCYELLKRRLQVVSF